MQKDAIFIFAAVPKVLFRFSQLKVRRYQIFVNKSDNETAWKAQDKGKKWGIPFCFFHSLIYNLQHYNLQRVNWHFAVRTVTLNDKFVYK